MLITSVSEIGDDPEVFWRTPRTSGISGGVPGPLGLDGQAVGCPAHVPAPIVSQTHDASIATDPTNIEHPIAAYPATEL